MTTREELLEVCELLGLNVDYIERIDNYWRIVANAPKRVTVRLTNRTVQSEFNRMSATVTAFEMFEEEIFLHVIPYELN